MGRPATDTKVLQLRGTYRKDRHAKREQKPTGDALTELPRCPKVLDSIAKAVWQRAGTELVRRRVLTLGGLDDFAAYCATVARAVRAETRLTEAGGDTYVTATGYERPRPEVAIAREAWAEARQYARATGLTPNGSGPAGGVEIPPADADEDFLFGQKSE